jgi:hypothetical protein
MRGGRCQGRHAHPPADHLLQRVVGGVAVLRKGAVAVQQRPRRRVQPCTAGRAGRPRLSAPAGAARLAMASAACMLHSPVQECAGAQRHLPCAAWWRVRCAARWRVRCAAHCHAHCTAECSARCAELRCAVPCPETCCAAAAGLLACHGVQHDVEAHLLELLKGCQGGDAALQHVAHPHPLQPGHSARAVAACPPLVHPA